MKKPSDEEIKKLMIKLDIDEKEAMELWKFDNDIIDNQEVKELTEKAKKNGTTKIKAREKAENKKTEREHKENTIKSFIIKQLYQKLLELDEITQLKIENKEKIITFRLNNNNYKIDLIQKRTKKED